MELKLGSKRAIAVAYFILSAFLIAGVAGSCSYFLHPVYAPDARKTWLGDNAVPLGGRWNYRWGDLPSPPANAQDWESFAFPGQAPGRGGRNELWLATKLPSRTFSDASLFIGAMDTHFEAYLDGRKIFAYGKFDGEPENKFLGYPWFIITLPPGYEGKTLYFRVHSKHDNIGPYGDVWVGPKLSQLARIVRQDLQKFIIGSVMVVFALGLMALYLRRRKEQIYQGFALVCLTLGTYIVCRSAIKQLLVYDPAGWFVLEIICFYLLPLSVSRFTDVIFGKNVFSLLTRIATAYGLVALVASGLGLVPILSTLLPFQILFLGCLAGCGYELIRRLGHGELDPKILAVGLMSLVVAGIHDVALAMGFYSSPFNLELSPWGLLGVVGSMSAITVRRFVEVYRRMESYSKDLESKSEALEAKNEHLMLMSQDLGRVAVMLGDKLNTPLEVMLLATEEIEDQFDEHIHDAKLRKELGVLQQFKRFAPKESLTEELNLKSFDKVTSDGKAAQGVAPLSPVKTSKAL